MASRVFFILILVLSLSKFLLAENSGESSEPKFTTYNNELEYTIYHKLPNQPEYSKRGELVVSPYVEYQGSDMSNFIQAFDAINKTQPNSLYLIKLIDKKNPQKVMKSFTKMCLLESSNFEDRIIIHLDRYNNVFHFDYYSLNDQCGGSNHSNFIPVEFKTDVQIVIPVNGVSPKLTRALPLREDGTIEKPPEEKSFIQKYWIYFAVLVVGLLLTGDDGQRGGGAGGGGGGGQVAAARPAGRQ
ncbi:hypothetical protein Glove_42g29 [Diversispora epigaea]|uniref:Uncharacterized protein n=1 Tax=Diversispora epigaea TaxID=1348612 RepID=A0A397JPU9_9GLOM|nr:hypothetical protein Glove_42g29 [Diversispora epigaea]